MNINEIKPDDKSRELLSKLGVTMLKNEPELWVRGTWLDENKTTTWSNIGITLSTGEVDKSVLYLNIRVGNNMSEQAQKLLEIEDYKTLSIPLVTNWKVVDNNVQLLAPLHHYMVEIMNQHFQEVTSSREEE
tara:strand:+ start:148 stop:543 length:396 start_codon:yes stop_codon:yes gene_type:complete